MPRAPRGGAQTAEAIRETAAALFFQHGYEATTLRELAGQVGIQVGSLYNHISGKDELLRDIMLGVMRELIAALEESILDEDDPSTRLRSAIDCHVRYHATHARETFIGNSELRSLPADDRKKVVSLRREYEATMSGLVEQACLAVQVDPLDLRLQTYAIIAVGTHVATWYKPHGRYSLDSIVETYTTLIWRQLGLPDNAGKASAEESRGLAPAVGAADA